MASAAISGVIMLAQPGQHAAFQSLAVHGAGVVAAIAKHMVGTRHSSPDWERCAPLIRLCLLGEPKPGRHQAVKAEAAKRGRDSASLYGLRSVRFTAVSSKRTCRRMVWPKATNHRPH